MATPKASKKTNADIATASCAFVQRTFACGHRVLHHLTADVVLRTTPHPPPFRGVGVVHHVLHHLAPPLHHPSTARVVQPSRPLTDQNTGTRLPGFVLHILLYQGTAFQPGREHPLDPLAVILQIEPEDLSYDVAHPRRCLLAVA